MTSEAMTLLQEAKRGGAREQGKLLSLYTNYLKIMAQSQLDRRIRRRVSPSDLVQETLLEAHRDFSSFRGETNAEFVGWLRQILVHNLIRATEKHLQTDKRDVRREVYFHKLNASIEHSSARLEHVLASPLEIQNHARKQEFLFERKAADVSAMAMDPMSNASSNASKTERHTKWNNRVSNTQLQPVEFLLARSDLGVEKDIYQ